MNEKKTAEISDPDNTNKNLLQESQKVDLIEETIEKLKETSLNSKNNCLFLFQFHPFQAIHEMIDKIKKTKEFFKEQLFKYAITLPITVIESLKKELDDETFWFGTDRMLCIQEGSFTKSVAIPLLMAANVHFVLINLLDEAFQEVNSEELKEKISILCKAQITPIISLKETQIEFDDETSKDTLEKQMKFLTCLPDELLNQLYILYNPKWIQNGLWEASNERLKGAYALFNQLLNETFIDKHMNELKVIYAVPHESDDLKAIMDDLPAAGYAF